MESIPFNHPDFHPGQVGIVPVLLVGQPKLLVNGQILKPGSKPISVVDRHGKPREFELRASLLDAYPQVVLDGKKQQLGDPIPWYVHLWFAAPIALMFVGGALGGALGATASFFSYKVYRSELSDWARYALSGLITLGSVAIFLVMLGGVRFGFAHYQFKSEIQKMNDRLPQKVDHLTQHTSIKLTDGVLYYEYTVSEEFDDGGDRQWLQTVIRPNFVHILCESDLKNHHDFVQKLNALYKMESGANIGSVQVTVDDCR